MTVMPTLKAEAMGERPSQIMNLTSVS